MSVRREAARATGGAGEDGRAPLMIRRLPAPPGVLPDMIERLLQLYGFSGELPASGVTVVARFHHQNVAVDLNVHDRHVVAATTAR